MYQKVQRTCRVIVLLIKAQVYHPLFVWWAVHLSLMDVSVYQISKTKAET